MAAPKLPSDFAGLVSDPSSSLCGNFINTLLKLPTYLSQIISYVFDSSGNISTAVRNQIVKPGDFIFSGTPSAEDATRLLCDGRQMSQTTYAALYAAIGDSWADGATPSAGNFFLPDCRARFPIGVGALESGDPADLGTYIGEEKHVLTVAEGAQDPEHQHVTGKFINDGNDNMYVLVAPPQETDEALSSRKLTGAGSTNHKDITDASITGEVSVTSDVRPVPAANDGHKTIPPAFCTFVYIAT